MLRSLHFIPFVVSTLHFLNNSRITPRRSGEQSPGCVTYRSITGPADAGGLTSYNCGPSATELLALGSPAAGAAVSTLASTAPVVGVGFGPGGIATTIGECCFNRSQVHCSVISF
jgi:hypothetical protein